MLKLKEIPDSNIVEIHVDGRISEEDFSVVTTILENKIKRQGKLKVLEKVKSFPTMSPSLWLKDIKFGLSHWNDFEKAAVVCDQKWMHILSKGVNPFIRGEIRPFANKDIRKARVWLTK